MINWRQATSSQVLTIIAASHPALEPPFSFRGTDLAEVWKEIARAESGGFVLGRPRPVCQTSGANMSYMRNSELSLLELVGSLFFVLG